MLVAEGPPPTDAAAAVLECLRSRGALFVTDLRLLRADCGLASRHKMTVSEWNGRPVTATEGQALLEAAGFVRDYQDLTLYAAWR